MSVRSWSAAGVHVRSITAEPAHGVSARVMLDMATPASRVTVLVGMNPAEARELAAALLEGATAAEDIAVTAALPLPGDSLRCASCGHGLSAHESEPGKACDCQGIVGSVFDPRCGCRSFLPSAVRS